MRRNHIVRITSSKPRPCSRLARLAGVDEVLSGGITNAGAVLRRGEIVDRPAQPHAAAIHRFLEALPQHGFTAAPRPVGLADAREQLTYVSGDVALMPYPAWSMADAALTPVWRTWSFVTARHTA